MFVPEDWSVFGYVFELNFRLISIKFCFRSIQPWNASLNLKTATTANHNDAELKGSFQNWLKSILIDYFVRKGQRIGKYREN